MKKETMFCDKCNKVILEEDFYVSANEYNCPKDKEPEDVFILDDWREMHFCSHKCVRETFNK